MPRLIPCPSCHAHVLVGDHECPHCEAPLRSVGAPLAAAVIAGLVLASCVAEPEYGVPATTGPEPATSTTADTDGSTDSTHAGTTSSTSLGADTDGSTDSTHAGTSSTTDGDASAGEADYGTAGLPATDTETGTTGTTGG